MQRYLSFLRVLVLGVISLVSCAAHAQEADGGNTGNMQESKQETRLGLGVGAEVSRSPYRDFGNKTTLLPLILYDSARFHVAGTTADLKLGSVNSFDFTLRAKYANEGYKSGDASVLNGMNERKDGFWLGTNATWRMPYSRLSLEWLKDASGNSNGQTVKLVAGTRFSTGTLKLTPHLDVTWMDSDYIDYYFGVKKSEATATRAAYSGKSTTNTSLGLRVDYSLTMAQSLFLEPGVTYYGSGITDSPLVDRSISSSVRLGYLYKF